VHLNVHPKGVGLQAWQTMHRNAVLHDILSANSTKLMAPPMIMQIMAMSAVLKRFGPMCVIACKPNN
jgi:hypothetical protein